MHKEVRDMILMVSDRAEELGDDGTAWALRGLVEGPFVAARELRWRSLAEVPFILPPLIDQHEYTRREYDVCVERMMRERNYRYLTELMKMMPAPESRLNQPITDRE